MKIIKTSTVSISLNILLKAQLRFLKDHFEIIAISSPGEDLMEVKHREGVQTISVKMERKISPFKDLISLFKLYFVFSKERPFIVHSITPKAGLLSMLAGKMAGVPIRMHTFTGLIFPTKTGLMRRLLIEMDRLLCWAATNIYPEGNGVKIDLESNGVTRKQLKILASGSINGIDLDYFNPNKVSPQTKRQLRRSLQMEDNDFVFVFVGRLVGDKGINELVDAFNNLKNKQRAIKLLLVGPYENNLDPLLNSTMNIIKSNSNIITVGFQKDVRPYLAISNALVFPSYREGFPNVVMQAGAFELPSIVTDINGSNEIIVDGDNGIVIPVKNSLALENAMFNIITNTALYERFKINSRRMIVERYRQQAVWQALLDEYDLLIDRHKTTI